MRTVRASFRTSIEPTPMPKRDDRQSRSPRKLRTLQAAFSAFETLESRQLLSATAGPNVLMTPAIHSGSSQTIATPFPFGSPPGGSTSPAQMRRFYSADNINFAGVPGDGRGMTIAIV